MCRGTESGAPPTGSRRFAGPCGDLSVFAPSGTVVGGAADCRREDDCRSEESGRGADGGCYGYVRHRVHTGGSRDNVPHASANPRNAFSVLPFNAGGNEKKAARSHKAVLDGLLPSEDWAADQVLFAPISRTPLSRGAEGKVARRPGPTSMDSGSLVKLHNSGQANSSKRLCFNLERDPG